MATDDIKGTAKDLSNKAGSAAQDAADQASKTASNLGDQASGYADQAKSKATDLYGQARDKVGDMADGAPDTLAAGKRAYRDGSEQLSRQVAKQPIEALLLAGAIGYLVGWAANRS